MLQAPAAPSINQQRQEAQQWIGNWRQRTNGASSPSGAAEAAKSNGAGPSHAEQNGASLGSNNPEINTVDGLPAELVARKESAQGWIQGWRERTGAK